VAPSETDTLRDCIVRAGVSAIALCARLHNTAIKTKTGHSRCARFANKREFND
jgi:hypothetical protein